MSAEPRLSAIFGYFGDDIGAIFCVKIKYYSVLDCSLDEEYP